MFPNRKITSPISNTQSEHSTTMLSWWLTVRTPVKLYSPNMNSDPVDTCVVSTVYICDNDVVVNYSQW